MRKHLLAIIIALSALAANNSFAQYHEIKSETLASLQVVAGNNWLSMPIATLNGEAINISFDDLTHEYHRYVYRLQHCEADWSVSEGIFESDYCEGFADGSTIDDIEESLNTNTLYTHYRLSIPNENCRIKMSGNYRLTVYDENEGDTVFTACFMVVEPLVKTSMAVTTNTDIDTNKAHQQVAAEINYSALGITNPNAELYTVVMQNGRWSTARINAAPQYQTGSGLRWEHNPDYIFNGGNSLSINTDCLVDHRNKYSVYNEPWSFPNFNRCLSYFSGNFHQIINSCLRGLITCNYFNKFHDRRRIKEMHTYHRTCKTISDFCNRKAGSIGSKNAFRFCNLV